MPVFFVRFKGMLTKQERERLAAAGIAIESKDRSLRIGLVKTGRPIFTARVEAGSEEEALQAVKTALDPDAANFTHWEVKPA